ncbi:hypothetical protein BOTNAR_0252g00060 [Botryotinia narcissicola]|uniref:Carrier domain-containing protein n=1 Tax=Botryotinia narcissicola TaxID=278944 RepID=A0A4Z1I0G9_9HELO|nr:hypothetical protein BOTNAR_0252g00060 [Botryotinia narcissicola]
MRINDIDQEIVLPSTRYFAMAMAIEATMQVVKFKDSFEEEISSYNIRGVALQKELLIPEEDRGIEIYFELLKASLNANRDHESMFESHLTSVDYVNGEDNFVGNNRGSVHVNFQPQCTVSTPTISGNTQGGTRQRIRGSVSTANARMDESAIRSSLKWATGSQKIFWSCDADPAQNLWDYTKGKGIDVILCNARDETMHNYWCRIAPMGRFVEIGRMEVLENGKLSLVIFRQTATFASFDLEVTCNLGPKVIGEKIVVGFEQRSSTGLKVRFNPFRSKFDPNVVYLLVGCLGDLGLETETRTRKLFSASFDLQGVSTQIVQGDVASLADVKSAVSSTDLPIKVVIQGALTLHDGLFSSMILDQFESTVRPRVIGTLNLHEAVKDSPLDFFQMWILRIGIVSYMPEYQQAMIRNDFYGNEKDGFLQYCNAGIGPASQTTAYEFDPQAQGYLLVGTEPAGLQEIKKKKYFMDDMPWSLDPRFRILVQATHMLSGVTTLGKETGDQLEGLSIVERIRHKISRLLYVDLDEVDTETPTNKYGIDSMIAAEIRNWLFTKFGKDVSLLTMLGATTTVTTLAGVVSKS